MEALLYVQSTTQNGDADDQRESVPRCEKQRYNVPLVVSLSNHEPRPWTGSGRADLDDADLPHQVLGELGLLGFALKRDMPVLGVCRGMQLLNLFFGGGLPRDVPGHGPELRDGRWEAVQHSIYLSPGSKLAAMLGMGGFFQVNSLHREGLREAQKSPRLLASAYSLEDGIIEGLESPEHSWAVGVQCQPERQGEVPKAFANLFVSFLERAEAYGNRA